MYIEQTQTIIAVTAMLFFPEGFAIGNGERKGNSLSIERNGRGNPVLRGSTLAGFMRNATEQSMRFKQNSDFYFGEALDKNVERRESFVHVTDCEFVSSTEERMHNRICRHTGSASTANKGLFSAERVAPGAECQLFFYLASDLDKDPQEDTAFMEYLTQSLNGAILGGKSNRGMGRCVVKDGSFAMQTFDMSKPRDAAAFLDLMYQKKRILPSPEQTAFRMSDERDFFRVEIELGIAEGQDILCSVGNDLYPVSVKDCLGKNYWEIPGSTFRGIFRSWMTRLVVRDGEKVTDSVERYQNAGDKKDVEEENIPDAIRNLFGSLYNKSRIHFSDAYSSCSFEAKENTKNVQVRRHVVIDRFTGGTNDGKLFEDSVLVDSDGSMRFRLDISILKPQAKEVEWLERTFRALNLGIVRIGSSKASGRMKVTSCMVISNPGKMRFDIE